MKTRLLSTVAATLLLTVGVASAQDTKEQAPARAPTTQQNAPAEKVAPPMKNASERKAPETTGQASPDSKGSMDKGSKGTMDKGTIDKSSEPAGQPKAATDDKGGMKSSSDTNKTQNNAQSNSPAAKPSTTGQGAAGAAKLSSEQQTKITTVIKSQKVERVEPSKLNISIAVGTRVPSSVRFHRLPTEVVTIYPEWRGYDYILVGDQIIILDPRSHEIVFIIAA